MYELRCQLVLDTFCAFFHQWVNNHLSFTDIYFHSRKITSSWHLQPPCFLMKLYLCANNLWSRYKTQNKIQFRLFRCRKSTFSVTKNLCWEHEVLFYSKDCCGWIVQLKHIELLSVVFHHYLQCVYINRFEVQYQKHFKESWFYNSAT